MFPKSTLNSLLDLIVTEAKCERMQLPRQDSRQTLPSNEMQEQESHEPIRKKQKIENGDHPGDTEVVAMQQRTSSEIGSACYKSENNGDFLSVSKALEKSDETSMATDTSVESTISDGKQRVTESLDIHEETPIFYHDLHKKKFHATVLPKYVKIRLNH